MRSVTNGLLLLAVLWSVFMIAAADEAAELAYRHHRSSGLVREQSSRLGTLLSEVPVRQ
jgi:hypothetical protein